MDCGQEAPVRECRSAFWAVVISALPPGLEFSPLLLLAGEPGCEPAAAPGWVSPG